MTEFLIASTSRALAERGVVRLSMNFAMWGRRFDPQWLPRVLAFRHPTDLARIGLLYAGAEGFLAVPGIGELLVPKAVGGVASPSAPVPLLGPSGDRAA